MFFKRKKAVDAKRVGSTLVATFHNSDPSLIWTFDLERNHSFTVTLQGEEGDFELGVTSPKGEFYPVARFMTREDATEALQALQRVLMTGRLGWFVNALKSAAAIALLVVIILGVGGYVVGHSFMSGLSSDLSSATPQIHNGVPMPADQVLRPPP